MALVVRDRVKQFSTTSGTGTLTLGATPNGFQSFSTIGDGNTTYYTIVNGSTGDFEVGIGTYTLSGDTLSRDTVLASSNSGNLVNFNADSKDVFVVYPAERAVFTDVVQTLTNKTISGANNTITNVSLTTGVTGTLPIGNGGTGQTTAGAAINALLPAQTSQSGKFLTTNGTDPSWSFVPDPIPSGTKMLFQQTAAPTGWTKDTTHDNKALRVVSGTAGSGGSVAFTTAFASQAVSGSIANTTATGTVGGTALTSAQLPSHTHTFSATTSNPSVSLSGTFTCGKPPGRTGIFTQQASGLAESGSGSQATASRYAMDATHTHTLSGTTGGTGSGSTHTHTFTGTAHDHTFTGTAINLAVQYVDIIIATKD
jgi:hypothetical protein